jgi:membrane protease YdiL (CAAX protease family)
MRHLLLFAVLVASVYGAGALVAPLFHATFGSLLGMPFQDSLSRSVLLCGIVAGLLYLRGTGSFDRAGLGWPPPGARMSARLPVAILAGLAVMAAVEGTQLFTGLRVFDIDLNLQPVDVVRILVAAMVLGTVVGVLEETLFRGALYTALDRRGGLCAAVMGTSFLYSAVHFVKYPPWPADAPVHWHTGFVLLSGSFRRLGDPAIADAFLTLLVLGILLALVRRRSGNVVQCIGFHGGLVAGLEVAGDLTRFVPENRYRFLVNKYDPELGWITLAWMTLAALLYIAWSRRTGAARDEARAETGAG